jgi:hypothetical protein
MNKPYFNLVVSLMLLLALNGLGRDIIALGNRRELMIDRFLIERMQGTQLILHEPHDEGAVLLYNKPWEGAFCGYSTVIQDSGTLRLYYRGLPNAGLGDGNSKEVTCYAESQDGIHWDKPDLGLYQIDGSLQNNVILADAAPACHNFSPFLDTRRTVAPEERFKALAGTEKSGLLAFGSKDGIHWRRLRQEPVLKNGMFDSQNVAFWSETENCYVCYFRTWTGAGYSGFRTVSRSTSTDFYHWTAPIEMSYGDTPKEHIYINQTHPYFNAPHIYIAVAARFMPDRHVLTEAQAQQIHVNAGYFKDCSDVVLMSSRGSNVYDRTFMEAFIAPGIGWSNWVSRSNYPALNVVPTKINEMSVYVNQNYAQPTAALHRYSLRLDGFASLYSAYSGGEMITKPFTFSGDRLVLNFRTSAAGQIAVEIRDQADQPIPGFTLADCRLLIGNEVNHTVDWTNGASLTKLAGRPIRLRLVLQDAHVFALQFLE